MKAKTLVACLMALMAGLTPSLAKAITGNDLQDACTSRTQNERTWCTVYILAIADVLNDGNAINGYRACVDEGVSVQQTVDLVTKYLAEHPEQRDRTAPGIVAGAFREAFQCE